jgi:putative transposase
MARVYRRNQRNYEGQSLWEKGYFVSNVGQDEEVIRNYLRNREKEEERLEQLKQLK